MKKMGLIFLMSLVLSLFTSYNPARGSYSQESPGVKPNSSEGYLFTEVIGDLLTVDIRDVALEEVLKQIATQNGIKFLFSPSVGKEKVMVRFSDFKIAEGLNKILAPYNRIFIYFEEDHNSHQPPLTRLTEVRIYPSHKGDKEGRLEVASVTPPKASKPSLKNKDKGEKRGRKSVETLFKSLKNKNPRVRVEAVKGLVRLAKMGNKKATEQLSLALEDKNPQVRKEAEKALKKMEEDLEEGNADNSQTDEDVEESPSEGGGGLGFAVKYNSSDQGNQGSGREINLDIRLNDVSEQLITAGFWITYDPSNMSIVDANVYDGSTLSGPWDPQMTRKVPDAGGPGTYMVGVGNLGNVSPDANSNINIANVRFICKGECNTPITISTISGFDTVVSGNNGYVYDSKIKPTTVTSH